MYEDAVRVKATYDEFMERAADATSTDDSPCRFMRCKRLKKLFRAVEKCMMRPEGLHGSSWNCSQASGQAFPNHQACYLVRPVARIAEL